MEAKKRERERRESNRKPAKAWWSWLDDKTFFVGEKEIFENNFTLYQISHNEMSISEVSSSSCITIDNNLFFYEFGTF